MGKLVVANWKMNKTNDEAEQFIQNLCPLVKKNDQFWICPPATVLSLVFKNLNGIGQVGAQNIYFETKGAFTGEISAPMVKSAGATFCLVGHSERRHIFGESNEELAKKICAAVGSGLKVIYCVGETIDEHTRLKSVLTDQLSALKGCDLKCVIIAYEPVWAIGTGKVAKQADIIKAHKFIKEYINKTYGTEVRVLYGGSVNSENANEILSLDVVDGVLVGGASLDAIKFSNIVNVARKF